MQEESAEKKYPNYPETVLGYGEIWYGGNSLITLSNGRDGRVQKEEQNEE